MPAQLPRLYCLGWFGDGYFPWSCDKATLMSFYVPRACRDYNYTRSRFIFRWILSSEIVGEKTTLTSYWERKREWPLRAPGVVFHAKASQRMCWTWRISNQGELNRSIDVIRVIRDTATTLRDVTELRVPALIWQGSTQPRWQTSTEIHQMLELTQKTRTHWRSWLCITYTQFYTILKLPINSRTECSVSRIWK